VDILQLFCEIDYFCKVFEKLWQKRRISDGTRRRNRQPRLSLSEVMTILVMYHRSGYKNLKSFYLFGKNKKANLSKAERNEIGEMAKRIKENHRE